jgi:predicted nucleic acid-binding protein
MTLGKLGRLELLSRLYGVVLLPSSVYTEVVIQGRERGYADALLVQRAIQRGQLVVVKLNAADLPSEIASLPLAAGEKQVLWLALRDKADLVLLDDLKARQEAQAHGLTVKGTLGVLVQAYRGGIISLEDVQTLVEVIIAREDIWIADELCRRMLARLKIS